MANHALADRSGRWNSSTRATVCRVACRSFGAGIRARVGCDGIKLDNRNDEAIRHFAQRGHAGGASVGACSGGDIAGLVATGCHESPISYAHVTTSTTHKTLRGPRGGIIMSDEETNKRFNFNKAIFPGIQGGPLMHVIAGKAVCFKEALKAEFKEYQRQVVKNAGALAEALMERDFDLVSGGTDNHLMLIDLRKKNITGKDAENLFWRTNITCNKNSIPKDPEKPMVTSGLRIGTPAITTRGMTEPDMKVIAEAMDILAQKREVGIEKAKAMIKSLTEKYPIYEAF